MCMSRSFYRTIRASSRKRLKRLNRGAAGVELTGLHRIRNKLFAFYDLPPVQSRIPRRLYSVRGLRGSPRGRASSALAAAPGGRFDGGTTEPQDPALARVLIRDNFFQKTRSLKFIPGKNFLPPISWCNFSRPMRFTADGKRIRPSETLRVGTRRRSRPGDCSRSYRRHSTRIAVTSGALP
jgi:hypothetical protein